MSIESFKHKDTRPLIPSSEEAGAETACQAVQTGRAQAEFPKNPVVHRGQDPELFWLNKYGQDDTDGLLRVDIRSLYRHEHIAPETLINRLYRVKEVPSAQLDMFNLFGNSLQMDELDKIGAYYQHQDGWQNRLIQGDSLLVMTSLLEREGMAGKVQCIYIDPPYGIKYGSNWQIKLDKRDVKDGSDDDLTGEPEQIKAFRDTWELGIHSYLSYLRDRLLVARELLHESGSCFVQISDENVHLVRCVLDEVFGSNNFITLVTFIKTTSSSGDGLSAVSDYLVWYAKDREVMKRRTLFIPRTGSGWVNYNYLKLKDGSYRRMSTEEFADWTSVPEGSRIYRRDNLTSQRPASGNDVRSYVFEGKTYTPGKGTFKTDKNGLDRLSASSRIEAYGTTLAYRRFADDFPFIPMSNLWTDTLTGGYAEDRYYVVQTVQKVISRCILMTTDPGDLVLDPTCGSGTTAYVCEQWGRRWITIDTSRIALNIAKTRLMTATFPYYRLHDEQGSDIRQGFVYKRVPHLTLKSIANNEPPDEETLYDQPEPDSKRLRVAGPFTVETLQSFEPIAPELLDRQVPAANETEQFEARIFEHLKSAGVKNRRRDENAVFFRVDRLNSGFLHAEGFYRAAAGESKAYIHIGPKFGTVSRLAVNEAVKECRARGDGDWLIILGFSFESDISDQTVTTSAGGFEVTRVRMHDDLLQEGLLKRDKKAASFVTIGEPDIKLHPKGKEAIVEILGLDIYDPIRDEVKARDLADIAYWMVDEDYDGSNFIVRQVFFCGGDRDEFDKWRKGLESLVKAGTRKRAEQTLRIEIDDEAFGRVYSFKSHPIPLNRPHQRIAVRVISQFGEECTKVLSR